jgi:hypothetical protein
MTTLFSPYPTAQGLAQSGYGPLLETIAPGITRIITTTATDGEPWFSVLNRNLIYLNATPDQRALLRVQAQNAAAGLPPQSIINATSAAAVADAKASIALPAKPDLLKILSVIGTVVTVSNWVL